MVRLFGFSKYPNYIERIGILVDLVRFFRAKTTLEETALGFCTFSNHPILTYK